MFNECRVCADNLLSILELYIVFRIFLVFEIVFGDYNNDYCIKYKQRNRLSYQIFCAALLLYLLYSSEHDLLQSQLKFMMIYHLGI